MRARRELTKEQAIRFIWARLDMADIMKGITLAMDEAGDMIQVVSGENEACKRPDKR